MFFLGNILEPLGGDHGSAGTSSSQTVKARASPACVLFTDGELPGCRWPDFNFSCLLLQQLLLMFFFFCCSVLLQGQVYPESRRLSVLHAGGAAEIWGRKRNEECGGCLWTCSSSAQFQETWKIRQLIAKPGVGLNTTQMLHNVYYLNFSIL